jgi:XRE family aerobic/anaerobic benzoate catabolism transcriptional regulator
MAGDDQRLRTLGKTVRAIRHEHELSQETVARLGGTNARQVGKLERGGDVLASTLLKVAAGLDVTLAEIGAAYEERLNRK